MNYIDDCYNKQLNAFDIFHPGIQEGNECLFLTDDKLTGLVTPEIYFVNKVVAYSNVDFIEIVTGPESDSKQALIELMLEYTSVLINVSSLISVHKIIRFLKVCDFFEIKVAFLVSNTVNNKTRIRYSLGMHIIYHGTSAMKTFLDQINHKETVEDDDIKKYILMLSPKDIVEDFVEKKASSFFEDIEVTYTQAGQQTYLH